MEREEEIDPAEVLRAIDAIEATAQHAAQNADAKPEDSAAFDDSEEWAKVSPIQSAMSCLVDIFIYWFIYCYFYLFKILINYLFYLFLFLFIWKFYYLFIVFFLFFFLILIICLFIFIFIYLNF